MNNHRKVLVFIMLTTFIYVLLSIFCARVVLYFPSFNNVSLFAEVEKDKAPFIKNLNSKAVTAIADAKTGRCFENYLKKGTIISFNADTLQSALQNTNKKLLQLANGENVKVRIAWFGDSQIEGDLITKDVRELLQNYFNKKNGVGFVPLTSVCGDFRQTAKVSIAGTLEVENFKQMNANSKLYLSGYSYFGSNFEVFLMIKWQKARNKLTKSGCCLAKAIRLR